MNRPSQRLADWLSHTPRGSSRLRFAVSDLTQRFDWDSEVVGQLATLMIRAKTNRAVLESMADALGWADAGARLRRSQRQGMRRGDFGEALAVAVLEDFEGYHVPVVKLRYQTDPEQSLHGTDVVAFEVSEQGKVRGLHFVECKLRTSADLAAGVEAHEQLAADRRGGFADTLMFLADRLAEIEPDLFMAFKEYLADRGREERGTYGIVLVWERAAWDEDVLVRIDEVPQLLDELHVRVPLLNNLGSLIEQTYDALDVAVLENGS